MGTIGVVLLFAFLAESMTEYLFGDWVPSRYIKYVAAAVGILLAVVWNVNVPRDFLHLEGLVPWSGQVLTGLLLGRGSNFLNDLVQKYLGSS